MTFRINKNIFGETKDTKRYFVFSKENENNVTLDTVEELEKFCSVYDLNYSRFPNEKWITVAKTLHIENPIWSLMIPKEEYESLVVSYIKNLLIELKTKTTDKLWYYSKLMPRESEVLSSFNRVCYLDGTEKPPYSYKRTAVGRFVSENNINLFLMNQERRIQTLETRFAEGNIVSVDVKALEPRVMLAVLNPEIIENCEDVYQTVATLSGLNVDRNSIKLCLLKILNGASNQVIMDGTDLSSTQATKLREFVHELFKYKEKVANLRETANEKGRIFNYFGRPHSINTDNDSLLFTYFMQSTSAEVCIILFSKIVRLLKAHGIEKAALPIAMIYDSFILDVKDGVESKVEAILEDATKIKIENKQFSFPMSFTVWNKE